MTAKETKAKFIVALNKCYIEDNARYCEILDELFEQFISQLCKEQREICAESIKDEDDYVDKRYYDERGKILLAKQPEV